MARNEAGLKTALERIPKLREEFWRDVNVPGSADTLNQALEKAGRVADFFELAELMCLDALERRESCGGHFREEYQTPDGEALRDDEHFAYVAAWEYAGRASRRYSTRSRSTSSTCISRSGATNERHVARLASGGARVSGQDGRVQGERNQPRGIVPRDDRRRERGAHASRARSRSPSITTVAKASAACAA